MAYRHKIVQGLADLILKYGGGKTDNPMMAALWWGLKGQIPIILHTLDSSEELVEEIRGKLIEVLDIKPEPVQEPVQTFEIAMTGEPEVIITPLEEQPIPLEEIKEVVAKEAPRKRKKGKGQWHPITEGEITVESVEEDSGNQVVEEDAKGD